MVMKIVKMAVKFHEVISKTINYLTVELWGIPRREENYGKGINGF
jgi:hypothetical protein